MRPVIGVDAGGTSTRSALFIGGPQELLAAHAGQGNINTDIESALSNIVKSIRPLVELKQAAGAVIVVGAAGVGAKENEQALSDRLEAEFPGSEIHIMTDAQLALYAQHSGQDGIIVISGTGSIAYGRCANEFKRVGGWGNLIADNGSGYAIAITAIKNLFSRYDNEKEHTDLDKALFEATSCNDVFELTKYVYTVGKNDIASLAPLVTRFAIGGDEEANQILAQAAKDIYDLVRCLYEKMAFKGVTPVCVRGGVLHSVPAIYGEFKRLCEESLPVEVIQSEVDSTVGAYYYALGL